MNVFEGVGNTLNTEEPFYLNQGLQPLVNFNFMLRVEGVFDLPCKAVHGFKRDLEYEYIQEGGINDYIHLRRKPITKPFTFTVERYAAVDRLGYDPLQEGAELVLPLQLFVSRYAGGFDVTRRVYLFTGCTVISKEYGELNAEQSGLVVDRTVIAYREMTCTNTPWDMEKDAWVYSENNRKNIYAKNTQDKSKNAVPVKWAFQKEETAGNRVQSANQKADEASIDADQLKKRRWAFVEGSTQGNGMTSASRTGNTREENKRTNS